MLEKVLHELNKILPKVKGKLLSHAMKKLLITAMEKLLLETMESFSKKLLKSFSEMLFKSYLEELWKCLSQELSERYAKASTRSCEKMKCFPQKLYNGCRNLYEENLEQLLLKIVEKLL